jgi:uncharacterized protein DUF2786
VSDAILDKVRKLLAKAEDPACTPAEAEAFTEKAAALIAKYGVDAALLAESDPTRDPVGDRVLDIPAPYATEKCTLLSEVAGELRCRAVRRLRRGFDGKEFSMHLFGHAADLERVEVLFTSLLVQASFALAAQRIPGHEHVAAYRRSWLIGFARAVGQRLRVAEQRAAAQADPAGMGGRSVALVLANRTAEVDRKLAEAYPTLTFAPPRRLAGGGMRAGYTAGQQADLGGVRLHQAHRRRVGG